LKSGQLSHWKFCRFNLFVYIIHCSHILQRYVNFAWAQTTTVALCNPVVKMSKNPRSLQPPTQTFMEASFPGVCSAVYLKKCRQTCAERLREDWGMRYETGSVKYCIQYRKFLFRKSYRKAYRKAIDCQKRSFGASSHCYLK
jgi:hypothetical protein